MKAVVREHGVEALIGLLVVAVAVWFVVFAWNRTGGGAGTRGALTVNAQFQNASGIKIGTDVRVAGIKVGQVASMSLDAKTYMANVALALDPATKVPADSSLAVSSEGILGGSYLAIMPGGDPTPLKAGDTIFDTQGGLDLNSLIGQFINKSGGSAKPDAAGGNEAVATPAS